MHQRKTHNCARLLSGLSGQPSPCVVGKRGQSIRGGENRLQACEGMKEVSLGNLCLPIVKIALQFPRHHSCGP